jgi:hypothetical protein
MTNTYVSDIGVILLFAVIAVKVILIFSPSWGSSAETIVGNPFFKTWSSCIDDDECCGMTDVDEEQAKACAAKMKELSEKCTWTTKGLEAIDPVEAQDAIEAVAEACNPLSDEAREQCAAVALGEDDSKEKCEAIKTAADNAVNACSYQAKVEAVDAVLGSPGRAAVPSEIVKGTCTFDYSNLWTVLKIGVLAIIVVVALFVPMATRSSRLTAARESGRQAADDKWRRVQVTAAQREARKLGVAN